MRLEAGGQRSEVRSQRSTGKITILVDNSAGEGLSAEHGLAMWIEADGKQILFDTGQGKSLEPNARALGVDLGGTDLLVLSHGHFDHTGAIAQVLRRAPKADIYCHSGVVRPRYAIRNGASTPIHMPRESMTAIDRLPLKQLHWVHEPVPLSADIGITGPVPRKTTYEDTGGPFYLDFDGKRPDPIADDLAVWIRTDQGLVVCAGCSHSGVVNTLDYALSLSGESKIRAVIGGFHLIDASRDRMDRTIAALRRLEPALVVPCHCTGGSALEMLHQALGEIVVAGASGMTFQFQRTNHENT